MASLKQNDTTKPESPDVLKGHGLSFNHSKMESFSGAPGENEKISVLSPSKSTDPARKKMFKITSVKKGGCGNGDVGTDNDADSVDGLDESQTEDFSSEFYDSSKATDLDMDLQDYLNMPLSPDDVATTTTIVVKQQKPDQHSQSRFKVVKIETKEPFRRGKWICYDFYDTSSGAVVTVEKNDPKMTEDAANIPTSLSEHVSSSNSVVQEDAHDSSSNLFVLPVVPLNAVSTEGHPIHSDVFVPIQPAPANQVLSQLDGLSSDVMAPFIAQQVLMSMAGVPSSSNSFHNLAQPGQTTIIQSLPHSSLYPYDQSVPPGMFQNGLHTGHTSETMSLPTEALLAIVGSGNPNMMATAVPAASNGGMTHNQAFTITGGLSVPNSHSQTQVGNDQSFPVGLPQTTEIGTSSPAGLTHALHSKNEAAVPNNGISGDHVDAVASESSESIKTLQGVADANQSDKLKEAVDAVGEMYMGLEGNEDDPEEGGGSSVAIDNKIEQAMDLVKRHLMYAVREEVEILKQQIGEMMERIGQLEYENTVLRSEAKPETLNKLQQARVTQTSQTSLPIQNASTGISPNPQQTSSQQVSSQVQPSQQTMQPPS